MSFIYTDDGAAIDAKIYPSELDIPLTPNDAEMATFREYFKALLSKLIEEGERFSGKRPLGNSGWQFDLYTALITRGLIKGTLDEDGYVDEVDYRQADKKLLEMIKGL